MSEKIAVQADKRLGDCPHFWGACGDDYLFDWTFQPAGEFLLEEIHRTQCIRWFRNHYALSKAITLPDGRTVEPLTRDSAGKTVFDFSGVDAVYDRWLAAGVQPIVELDYVPRLLTGEHGDHFGLPTDMGIWRDLMRDFVRHLQERYGIAQTRRWYFEVWNEPDKWPRDRFDEFFRLYDEFAAAMEEVDPQLRFGGPAAYVEFMAESFMHHVTYGTNHVTGRQGTRTDYVSYHHYGCSGHTLGYYPALFPYAENIAHKAYWLYEAFKRYPGMIDKEFHFNEWGLVSNFERTSYDWPALEMRNSEYTPLFMMKMVHQLFTIADAREGFLPKILLYWGGGYEAGVGTFAGNLALVTAGPLAKPMLRGFQLMAQLGDVRLASTGGAAGRMVGLLPTYGDGTIRLLVYNFAEGPDAIAAETNVGPAATVDVEVTGLRAEGANGAYAGPAEVEITRLDQQHGNAYRLWQQMGKPRQTDATQLAELHQASDLNVVERLPIEVTAGRSVLKLAIPAQGAAIATIGPKDTRFAVPHTQADDAAKGGVDLQNVIP